MLSESYLNQIERCKEFIVDENGGRIYFLLVHIFNMYDVDTNELVPIGKIDTILRMNGYKGILILDDRKDNYFIIDIHNKKMINLPGEIEEFKKYAYKGKAIDFYDFAKMHNRIHGVFRNSITVTSKDKTETTTICLSKRYSWREFLDSENYKTGNYLIIYVNKDKNIKEVFNSLYERGYRNTGRAVESTPWLYVSLNTKLWFSGKIGVDLLSGSEPIGNHAITADEFYIIDDIYRKYEGYRVLNFKQ